MSEHNVDTFPIDPALLEFVQQLPGPGDGGSPDPLDDAAELQDQQEPHKRSLIDRVAGGILGVPDGLDELGVSRREVIGDALSGFGRSLLQSTRKTPARLGRSTPLSRIGDALDAARGSAAGSVGQQQAVAEIQREKQRRDILAGGGDIEALIEAGFIKDAGDLARARQAVEAAKPKLVFQEMPDGSLEALDPNTGDTVRKIGAGNKDQITLTPDQNQIVTGVRREFVRDTAVQMDQATQVLRIKAAAGQLQKAINSGDRRRASAASLTMIMAYARLNDPGSVVRSEEVRVIFERVGSITQKVDNFIEQLRSGTMSLSVLNSITEAAGEQIAAAKTFYDAQLDASNLRLSDNGIRPEFLRAAKLFGTFEEVLEDPSAMNIVSGVEALDGMGGN